MDQQTPGQRRRCDGEAKPSRAAQDASTLRNQSRGKVPSDILGSYTGTPRDDEVPEQDADDL